MMGQERSHEQEKSSESTVVHHTIDGAPYVICKSIDAFVNPTTPSEPSAKPENINLTLNLNLGQKLITRNNKVLLWTIKFLDKILVQWWESLFFYLYAEVIPLSWRRRTIFGAWRWYLAIHTSFVGKKTGLHPSQSSEYHALTSLLWWTRFFVISPKRIRFSLSQLHACAPCPPPENERIERVDSEVLKDAQIPKEQEFNSVVEGWYIHQGSETINSHESPRKVILWFYGGAYLGGDVRGNASTADWFGKRCGMDVFIPNVRLAPEADLDDVLWDACTAYKWLTTRVSNPSEDIFVLGISSGGAIAVRLMQLLSKRLQDKETGLPQYFNPILEGLPMPRGSILFAPYVNYETKKTGSFLHYARHDLIVNEAVQDYGLPYLESFIPKHQGSTYPRRDYSPCFISCQKLPPMCVIVSEHEAVHDMTIELVNRARADGVAVTVGVWKYMCHVFSFLHAFLPEGELSIQFAIDWILDEAKKPVRA